MNYEIYEIQIEILIGLVVLGAVVGVLAWWFVPGRNPFRLIVTLLLGAAGAVVGGYISEQIQAATWIGWAFGLVFAVAASAGASLVLAGKT